MSQHKTLDEIYAGYLGGTPDEDELDAWLDFKQELKAHILAEVLELIGEDEHESKDWLPKNPALETVLVARNRLKADLRTKAKERFK